MTTLYHGSTEDWTEYNRSFMDWRHGLHDYKNHLYLTTSKNVAKSYIERNHGWHTYKEFPEAKKKILDRMKLPKEFKFFEAARGILPNVLYYEITPYGELTGKALLTDGSDPAMCKGELIDVDQSVLEIVRPRQHKDNKGNVSNSRFLIVYGDGKYYNGFHDELVLPYGVPMTIAKGDLLREAKAAYFNQMINLKEGAVMKTIEVKLENPCIVECNGQWANWDNWDGSTPKLSAIKEKALADGHDGVIIRNVADIAFKVYGERVADTYIVFDLSRAKVINTEVLA